MLTTYADDDSLFPALRAGARGYLTKDAGAEEIERAIARVAAGRRTSTRPSSSGWSPRCGRRPRPGRRCDEIPTG